MTSCSNKEPFLFLELLFQFRIFGPAIFLDWDWHQKMRCTKVAIWDKLHFGWNSFFLGGNPSIDNSSCPAYTWLRLMLCISLIFLGLPLCLWLSWLGLSRSLRSRLRLCFRELCSCPRLCSQQTLRMRVDRGMRFVQTLLNHCVWQVCARSFLTLGELHRVGSLRYMWLLDLWSRIYE